MSPITLGGAQPHAQPLVLNRRIEGVEILGHPGPLVDELEHEPGERTAELVRQPPTRRGSAPAIASSCSSTSQSGRAAMSASTCASASAIWTAALKLGQPPRVGGRGWWPNLRFQ